MFVHQWKSRVKYGQTDQMGYLYYGNYPLFYEEGRTEAIRSLGMSYKSLEASGIIMPVKKMEMSYIRPALYDDLLLIESSILEFQPETCDLIFHTQIFNEKNKLVNKGLVHLVFFDPNIKKTVPMPEVLNKLLTPYFK
ncbi:MAG TPA: thioesterase family protein [Chitinophagaceae bacterium]|nr:thioesterase family protein [Chitinophagaceae bacterium]